MGDIFRRETAEHPEAFTGERLTAAIGGQVQIEHYHRYLFARSFVAGMDVLDVASGEGYGSALLAQVARSVIGIECSGPTVHAAAKSFPRTNLQFVKGDARALPLADASVDAVVSFETIEHFDRHTDFLREVRRILRPGGNFIVSTPDRDVYSPASAAVNEFHVREMSQAEFTALLHETFRHVRIMQQRPLIGSALLTDSGSPSPPLVFDRRGDTHFEACLCLPRAPYLVAVASDHDTPPLPPSLYIDRSDLDTETAHRVALDHQLRQAKTELATTIRLAEVARQEAEVSAQCAKQAVRRAEQEGQRAEQEAQRAEQEAQRAEQELLRSEQEAQRADQALRRADQEAQRAEQEVQRTQHAEANLAALRSEHDKLRGSLRTFLRGYLPLLRRHLFGQRP